MFEIAGALILAVLFFAFLPLILTRGFLAAAAVLLVTIALLAFVAVAPTDIALLAFLALIGVGGLVQIAYVARRDSISMWKALLRLGVKQSSTRGTRGIVPRSWQD